MAQIVAHCMGIIVKPRASQDDKVQQIQCRRCRRLPKEADEENEIIYPRWIDRNMINDRPCRKFCPMPLIGPRF